MGAKSIWKGSVMKLKVSRGDTWMATIEDRAGGAAEKLKPLAQAGADLEFVLVQRTPERDGKGIVTVAPIRGFKVIKAAEAAGFEKPQSLCRVRIEGPDKPGLAAKITGAVAGVGISFRRLTQVAIRGRFVAYLALDSVEDAEKAMRVLKKLS